MTATARKQINSFGTGITLKLVTQMLDITDEAKNELLKCDTNEFNIFKVRELT